MPDRNSFKSRLGEAMEDVRVAISEMVTWDVDIIGLNEVHPDFFSRYDRTITSAFPNMKFLGVPSGDAFVWRASCRLVSIVRVRGGHKSSIRSRFATSSISHGAPPGLTLRPVLTADEVGQFRVSGVRKEAHRWLAHLRQVCARAQLESIDMTDGLPDGVPVFDHAPRLVFDWKHYLCSLPHAWTLVGDGVTRFEGRFINCPEPNAEKLQLPEPYRGLRFDFVVHRVDGTCVRLHPSQGAEAQPVIGHLEPWLVQAGTVSVQAPPRRHQLGDCSAHVDGSHLCRG